MNKLCLLTISLALLFSCDTQSVDPDDPRSPTGKSDRLSDCADWCETRAPHEESDGWCGLSEDESCEEACVAADTDLPKLQYCVEENALCFVTLENCTTPSSAPSDCESWCETRAPHEESDGWCGLDFSNNQSCVEVCEQSDADPSDLQSCVEEDALCFTTLDSCTNPEPSSCESWCETRAPHEESDGWCGLDFSNNQSCVEVCEQSDADPVNLQTCVEEDALCFTTLESCTNPEPSSCESWCETRAPHEENDGWCSLDFNGNQSCVEVCESTAGTEASVQSCVEQNPLCFVSFDSCVNP